MEQPTTSPITRYGRPCFRSLRASAFCAAVRGTAISAPHQMQNREVAAFGSSEDSHTAEDAAGGEATGAHARRPSNGAGAGGSSATKSEKPTIPPDA